MNVRRYVRKNGRQSVRKYAPNICVYIDLDIKHSRLHQRNLVDGILFYLAHCSKYCWLNFIFVQGSEFGLAAMAEVVVERLLGLPIRWPKELSMCGATS